MIEVLNVLCFENGAGDDSYFASYRINNIKSWIFININDFYKWLQKNIPDYSREVRGRHFFFSKKSIVEDFNSKKEDRCLKARDALSRYFQCCYENGGLQDFSKMIDLQSMSLLFREVQLSFVFWDRKPFLSLNGGEYFRYAEKYGSNWVNELIDEGRRYNLRFFNDCAGHLYPDYNFRTLFYDSGSTREMQFDRQQGREKGK